MAELRLLALIVSAALAAAAMASEPCIAGEQPPPMQLDPTRAQALSAPVDQLVHDAFSKIESKFVEVERPTFTGIRGPNASLFGLQFATKAGSAGEPGLCAATVTSINFLTDNAKEHEPPISTRTVYKVVGSLKPLPDMWNDKYGAELSKKCESAGRVLPTESGDFGHAAFFDTELDAGIGVRFAVRALELAIQQYRENPSVVRCETLPPPYLSNQDCSAALNSSSQLDLSRLLSVKIEQCGGGPKDCYEIEGQFLRSAIANERSEWVLKAKAMVPDATAYGDVQSVGEIRLGAESAIFD